MPTELSPASRNGLIASIAACYIIATIVGVDNTAASDGSSWLARCFVSTSCSNLPLAPTGTGFISYSTVVKIWIESATHTIIPKVKKIVRHGCQPLRYATVCRIRATMKIVK
jgi:H+/Cl- antiporter ClcA